LIALLWSYNEIMKLNFETVSSDIDAEVNKPIYDKMKKFDEEFSDINSRAADILAISKDQIYWNKMFVELESINTEGIFLDGLATNNFLVSVSGEAVDRDSLIGFKSSLEESGCFTDVNLPLSNLVKKEDIAFQMDFKVREECVRNNKN